MVAASFAGGAVVNGPGLKWAQAWLKGGPPEPDSITVVNDDLTKARVDEPSSKDTSSKDDPPKSPTPVEAAKPPGATSDPPAVAPALAALADAPTKPEPD